MQTSVIYGLLIPFVGTSLGSACVFFLKKGLVDRVQRGLTGFASGVMVAASIWSLLIPAMDQSAGAGTWAFLPAVIGFWVGILFLLGLDHLIPHLHQKSSRAEGPHTQLRRSTMMVLAVTLHNIPEGMAVGVVYAGYLAGDGQITMMGALALSLGIAIQNFPEGAIISMPLRAEGMNKPRAFAGGGEDLMPGTVRFLCDQRGSDPFSCLHPAAQQPRGGARLLPLRGVAGHTCPGRFLRPVLREDSGSGRPCSEDKRVSFGLIC